MSDASHSHPMSNLALVNQLMAMDVRDDLHHAYVYDMMFFTAVEMIRRVPKDDSVIDVLLTALAKSGQELSMYKDKLVECEKRRIAPERRGAF